MAPQVKILVGTMTGTAELVADEMRDALTARGIASDIVPLDGKDWHVFDEGGPFLLCTSTYGQGDVPDNAQGFFASLETERPDLSRVAYGIIALGDRTYAQTYCYGGKRFDTLLTELGARRVGDMMLHDASAGTIPEEVAVDWLGRWIDRFREEQDAAA